MVRRTGWILCAVLVFTVLPYCIAALAAGPNFVFGGFLLNPLDGNSYLAKMRQGWEGSWQFHLPFSVEQGEGSYLFLFYILLGHIARIAGMPLVWVFHLARVAGSILLCLSISRLVAKSIQDLNARTWALILAVFGGGLGWLAFPLGGFTSDFWVAEAYPFLSAYANPHFPLSLAIVCWLLTLYEWRPWWRILAGILASVLLSILSPFGIVLVVGILVIRSIWNLIGGQTQTWLPLVLVVSGGVPLVVYQYVTIVTDPLLRLWNEQNITLTPPIWDLLVAFSPALWLTLPGAWQAFKRKNMMDRTLLTWIMLGLSMTLLPFGLQRRLMLGLFIPLSILAVEGCLVIGRASAIRFRRTVMGMTLLSMPTMILVLAAGIFGGLGHDLQLGIRWEERQAFHWIETNASRQSVVLASPDLGAFLPGWTGRRVFYGHPFETVHAEEQKKKVERFYESSGSMETLASLGLDAADIILWGPREREYGGTLVSSDFEEVFRAGDVAVFQVSQDTQ